MKKINTKTKTQIELMVKGGRKLSMIKEKLIKEIKVGVSAEKIEKLANKLISATGGKSSFKMVPGYSWATCINVGSGIVHGIPKKNIIFKKGDIVSVDVGLYYKGFHSDTSFTVAIDPSRAAKKFLNNGKNSLSKAIKKAVPGNRVYDISKTIQESLEENGLTPVRALVGHGIGKNLHEDPQIPCFTEGEREMSPILPEGAVLAIEVMYTKGNSDIVVEEDGWTISTKNDKISGLFEETVAVLGSGPLVLTKFAHSVSSN